MQYRTHFATTLAVSLPIMVSTGTLRVSSLVALSLGSVFPDIDEPHSWIGSRTRGLSDVIKLFFGHRGVTHSLLGLIIALLTIALLASLTPFTLMTGIFFLIGYTLHLIEDSFSKSGVKWLLPLTDKSFQFGGGVFYYKTGSFVENLILLTTILVLIFQIQTLDFSSVDIPDINIVQTVIDLFETTKSYVMTKLGK